MLVALVVAVACGSQASPQPAPDPAVGPERYARALQDHLGQTADPVELASWGWEELDRLEQESV